jgi:hypothetical protein
MLQTEPFNPFLVLWMGDDRHRVSVFLQPEPERNVRLHVASRSDCQAREMLRQRFQIHPRRQVDHLGKLKDRGRVQIFVEGSILPGRGSK